MSRCACNRWGSGTTCEKPSNTVQAKELEQQLAKLKAERAKLDTIWDDSDQEKKTSNDLQLQNNKFKNVNQKQN